VERQLNAGEAIHVDTGCVVAFEPSIQFDIEHAGGIKTDLFGGEGLFFAVMRGPGKLWLQSLPISRLASRIIQYSPQMGSRKEEGGILRGLGNMIDGDGF
ncbi:MAG: AIM24 family protein, partial [Bacteroidota bacterium]|nr:AIM24 family protein [Bacteroidota bacterium]